MRIALLSLALLLCGMSSAANAQCSCAAGAYNGGYAGYAPQGAYYAPYGAYYAPYATYAPFRARQPSYPMLSGTSTPAYYGRQSTYFRGAPGGPFAPPGGTFFGGYDYQLTYPIGWYGGYW
ncbi:MAG TPA: hypothetical protein VG125_11310 [Pirellulales bacterium]|jgi:hypothetical protein|nr:hypothetical protein [Pirellulales bacterium]